MAAQAWPELRARDRQQAPSLRPGPSRPRGRPASATGCQRSDSTAHYRIAGSWRAYRMPEGCQKPPGAEQLCRLICPPGAGPAPCDTSHAPGDERLEVSSTESCWLRAARSPSRPTESSSRSRLELRCRSYQPGQPRRARDRIVRDDRPRVGHRGPDRPPRRRLRSRRAQIRREPASLVPARHKACVSPADRVRCCVPSLGDLHVRRRGLHVAEHPAIQRRWPCHSRRGNTPALHACAPARAGAGRAGWSDPDDTTAVQEIKTALKRETSSDAACCSG